jgi:hypothetical protein
MCPRVEEANRILSSSLSEGDEGPRCSTFWYQFFQILLRISLPCCGEEAVEIMLFRRSGLEGLRPTLQPTYARIQFLEVSVFSNPNQFTSLLGGKGYATHMIQKAWAHGSQSHLEANMSSQETGPRGQVL